MRVIAGAYKGHRIEPPKGHTARPTLDRVREALFSMLGSIEGLRVLDLFAGSGALGIEAVSRGASTATFVDSDPGSVRAIETNVERLGLEQARVFRSDAIRFLEGAARHGECWDLVFLDPPYKLADRIGGQLESLLGPVTSPAARIVAESSKKQPLRLALPMVVERTYGDTLVSIHAAKGSEHGS